MSNVLRAGMEVYALSGAVGIFSNLDHISMAPKSLILEKKLMKATDIQSSAPLDDIFENLVKNIYSIGSTGRSRLKSHFDSFGSTDISRIILKGSYLRSHKEKLSGKRRE
ncbi:hypothetical protein CR513_41142, partial [Mucuna pruriens]